MPRQVAKLFFRTSHVVGAVAIKLRVQRLQVKQPDGMPGAISKLSLC